jgi:hypothetical protein
MAEKFLNSRLCLKYDSYENWSKAENQKDLLAGEIAIAYLTTAEAVSPATGDTQHPVLIKVGPGKFNDLPWLSALAADVYDWAKKENPDWNDFPVIPLDKIPELPADKLIQSKDYGKVTADTGSIEASAVRDTFAIKGANEISTKAENGAITIDVDLSSYAKKTDLIEDTNTAHIHANGSGIKLADNANNGGVEGTVQLNLNIAMELVNDNIVIYDKDDTAKTALASLDAKEFLEDGILKNVELKTGDADHAAENGPYLVFTWNIDTNSDDKIDVLWVPVKDLVDIYEGSANDDITVAVNGKTISATLNKTFAEKSELDGYKKVQEAKSGSFASAEVIGSWSQDVQGVVSVTARTLTPADIGAPTKEEMSNQDAAVLAEAQKYADSLNHEDTKYSAAADGGLKLNENNEFAIDDSVTFIFYCGTSKDLI